MKTYWWNQTITYDGSQLRPLFAYLNFEVLGPSIVGWRGPCAISEDKIVDGEDLLQGSTIAGSDMLHWIVELYETSLLTAVCVQRILVAQVQSILERDHGVKGFKRQGDDLYLQERKLNISVATQCPSSCLIHLALNVSDKGCPVPVVGLEEFQVPVEAFAQKVMQEFASEWASMMSATYKVRPVF